MIVLYTNEDVYSCSLGKKKLSAKYLRLDILTLANLSYTKNELYQIIETTVDLFCQCVTNLKSYQTSKS